MHDILNVLMTNYILINILYINTLCIIYNNKDHLSMRMNKKNKKQQIKMMTKKKRNKNSQPTKMNRKLIEHKLQTK